MSYNSRTHRGNPRKAYDPPPVYNSGRGNEVMLDEEPENSLARVTERAEREARQEAAQDLSTAQLLERRGLCAAAAVSWLIVAKIYEGRLGDHWLTREARQKADDLQHGLKTA